VTRGGIRSVAILAATVFVALLLGACGSSDSASTGGSTTAEVNAQGSGSAAGSEDRSGTQGENDAGGGGSQQSSAGKSSTGFTAEEVATPLKVSGGGSEQFRFKGGDNSIQEFGEEGDESELQEAAEAVHSLFVARAVGDWAKACSYLSKSMREQLEQLAASSTELKDKGCAAVLDAFTPTPSASVWRENTTVDAGSLRRDGEQAFLVYYGADKTVYAMPLKEEDGEFKVGALSGNPLG
jgi:hypothetical protein